MKIGNGGCYFVGVLLRWCDTTLVCYFVGVSLRWCVTTLVCHYVSVLLSWLGRLVFSMY